MSTYKHTYTVRYFEAITLSLSTQADHFNEAVFDTDDNFVIFCKRMFAEGFQRDYKTWIAPGAITKITQDR